MVISGYIFDENMKPISGASISAVGAGSTSSSASGAFALFVGNPLSVMTIEKAGYGVVKMIASSFNSYAQLEWTGELPSVSVENNYKSSNNSLYWIIGIAGAALLANQMSKPKKVTV